MAEQQFMIGNGAKQDPDTHRKKGWVRPRTADHRKKSGGKKGKREKGKGKTREKQRWLGCNHQ
jgi:hypothetical protein